MPLPPFSIVISALSDRLFLNGLVIPNGSTTTAQFEYGLTSSYGSVQAVTLGTPDATIAQQVSFVITGLTPNTTYHYRLTATNVHGTSSTPDRMLRTMDYSYHASHLAGTSGGGGMTDGTGRAARFVSPRAITSAPGGHFYVVDSLMNTIRKVTPDGMVTTFAGVAGQTGSADGAGAVARFFGPRDVAVDQSGNLYVTDSGNHTLRKITSDGLVTTLAGSAGLSGSADGTGGSARFLSPQGIALDATGNVYVSSNQTIRKITSAGVVTTLAGLAGVTGSADGAGSDARFNSPVGLEVVADGSLLVADSWNNTIRKINTTTGAVSTLAGLAGNGGFTDGTGSLARLLAPMNLALDVDGTVLVLSSSSIRRVTSVGVVSTLSIPGGVEDLTVSPAGEFFFTRTSADGPAVYRQNSIGVVSLLAGDPPESGSQDGPAEMARFNQPAGAGADGAGNIYVTDSANHTIRKVSNAGSVTTLAGLAGVSGSTDGAGSAARFTTPSDLAVDSGGNIFVVSNSAVRKITPDGIVSTLAALAGEIGSRIAVDGNGNVFLTKGHAIQKITSSGSVSTFAGDFLVSGSQDGTGTGARFNQPRGMVADGAGNLYVADSLNYAIRKITAGGVVTTFAGMAGQNGVVDGSGSSARFAFMDGLSLDESGNLYVSPGFPFRRISPSGEVTSFLPADLDTTVWRFFAAKSLVPLPGGSFCLVNDFEHKLQRLTPGPLVGRRPVSGLNTTTATLNARLDPNAPTSTTALFEYGTSTSYGSTAAVTLSPDSGVAEQSVSASLSGLLPATTYHYRLTATNARGTNSTLNGTFTTLNLQQGWRQTYFGSSANEGNAADTFDHDGDGIVNLLEWATGLNPITSSTLPASSTMNGADLEFHYTRLVAAIAAGAIFTVEWNDTLSPLGWSSAGVVETILSNNGTTQQVKATLPAGSSGKRFVRLRVNGAP
jgi:sugar lactone lactonase YvrE